MAGEIKTLIPLSEFKFDFLKRVSKGKENQLRVRYDELSDTLILLLVPPSVETVVHHVDKYVALLFLPDTLDIVGLQIDDFEYGFLPRHADVGRVWRLRESGAELPKDFGDIVLMVKRAQPEVIREIMRATQPALEQLGESAESLKEAMELQTV
jgi:hypothetical protein